MNAQEAGQLLIMLAAITGREPSSAQAHGWAFALEDLPFEVAKDALREACKAPDAGYITPTTLRKHAAPMLRRLAADVRSAKIRRLVPADWPETTPLPADAAQKLADEWARTNDASALAAGDAPRKEIQA